MLLAGLTTGHAIGLGVVALIFVTFALLGFVGYDARAHAVNGPDQIHGLELIFIIGPIAFVMLGGAAFIGYRLSAERHAEIRRQLDARDALLAELPGVDGVSPQPGDRLVTGS